jgi:dTDP-4-dehydrorhamnose reductase
VVFNCAAMTAVDRCETDPDRCTQINAAAVAELAVICRDRNSLLVHFSTDYVFDGAGDSPATEDRVRHPINHYGQGKAQAEEAIAAAGGPHLIARIQWVFGAGRDNFVSRTVAQLRKGEEVPAFSDQWGTPCFATDIATMVIRLCKIGARGLFHVTNSGYATRVQVAAEIARLLHISSPRISPVLTNHLSLPATRPLNSRLCIDKLRALGIHPPSWQDAISRYVSEGPFPL